MTYNQIIDRIGYFKNKKNLSSYELGLRLGRSRSFFYRIEHKEVHLTIEVLLEILEILEVTTSEFFYYDLNKYENDKEVLNLTSGLNTEEINSLKTILKRK